LRCTGLHNVALCTELRTVETAGKRALVLHRIAPNCTRWRPARSHRRYAIRAGHRLGPLPVTPSTPQHLRIHGGVAYGQIVLSKILL
jgi:hypothetical protein